MEPAFFLALYGWPTLDQKGRARNMRPYETVVGILRSMDQPRAAEFSPWFSWRRNFLTDGLSVIDGLARVEIVAVGSGEFPIAVPWCQCA
jgi:hypothetical protein